VITVAALSCVAITATAQFETRVLITSGETAPNGGVHEAFSSSQLPTMAEPGDVFVQNIIASHGRERAFVRVSLLGEREIVLIDGTPLDGGGTVGGGSPVAGDFTVNPVITPDGRLAFGTAIDGVPNDQDSGLFLIDPDTGVTTQIAREGQAVALPDGSTGAVLNALAFGQTPVARIAFDAAGRALWTDTYTINGVGREAMIQSDSGGLLAIQSEGDAIESVITPGVFSTITSFTTPGMNASGKAAFRTNASPTPSALTVADGTGIDFVLRNQQTLLGDDGCTIGSVLNLNGTVPAVNDAGQVGVRISLDAENDDDIACLGFGSGSLVLRFEPSGDASILIRRDNEVDNSDVTVSSVTTDLVTMNEQGLIATLANTSDRVALITADADGVTEVARARQPAPGGGEFRGTFASFALNDHGQIAFVDQLSDVPGATQTFELGLFLYTPGSGTELVLRTGQILDGFTITSIDLAGTDGNRQDRRADADGFNNAGTIAFRFAASDGTTGVAVAGDDLPQQPCSLADLAAPFGVVDLGDIDVFIAAFLSSDSAADIAAPFGVIDLSDLDAFIAAFLAGCG